MKLEHSNITVRDIDRSIEFYAGLFGFQVRWQGHVSGEDRPLRAAHVGNGETYLALFEAEQDGEVIHLEGHYEPGERMYFYDPDGVEIELVSY